MARYKYPVIVHDSDGWFSYLGVFDTRDAAEACAIDAINNAFDDYEDNVIVKTDMPVDDAFEAKVSRDGVSIYACRDADAEETYIKVSDYNLTLEIIIPYIAYS